MKTNKGITLIALTITIIVLIILASVTTYSGISTIKSSKLNKFKQELEIMQAEVNLLYEKYKDDIEANIEINIGKDISTKQEQADIAFSACGVSDTTSYRLFDSETMKEFNIEGIEREYLVNIAQRDVICLEGFEQDGMIFYKLEQTTEKVNIKTGIERNGVTFKTELVLNNNNKWEIQISDVQFSKYVGKGKIQYKLAGTEVWKTVESNYKGEEYSFEIDQENGNTAKTVIEAINQDNIFVEDTQIEDELGNKITIPAGFKVTNDGKTVGEGIVIQDGVLSEQTYIIRITDSANETGEQEIKIGKDVQQITDKIGNQFVWIPVGEYKNSSGQVVTNNLTRRIFKKAGPDEINGDDLIPGYYYGEGDSRSIIYGTEYNIDNFKTSVSKYGGYYIGRYEAGTEVERTAETDALETVQSKKNLYPYTFITRTNALNQAQAMYSKDSSVRTTLMSSYAYDTALNFICQNSEYGNALALISITEGSNYANIYTNNKCKTGEYVKDCYSNIYDFLGNVYEWSTEFSSDTQYESVFRGSGYRGTGSRYPALRDYSTDSLTYVSRGFRVELYLQ